MTDAAVIASLEELALAAMRRGDRAEAIRAWQSIVDNDPAHGRGLNALANECLAVGNAVGARALLERAARAEPEQPAILFNLAAACRGAGDLHGALSALQGALNLDPYFVQAIFQKAVLLEELGHPEEAALTYRDFIDTAPPEVTSDARFEVPLLRARDAVARSNARLEERIAKANRGSEPLPRRAHEAIDILLGKHMRYVAEPTFFTVPQLPAIPFFDRELTPWIAELEAATPQFVSEALSVMVQRDRHLFAPYVANPPGVASNQWHELNHSLDWGAFFFWKHGEADQDNARVCPNTAALLASMPLLRLSGRGPNAFFSMLAPATRIPPHTGVANLRSTVHLPLIVPPGCGFRVGAETREWRVGEAWVFDDTIEHEAWNESDLSRLILIFDVWNPLLSAAERTYYADVLSAYDRHVGRSAASEMF